MFNISEKTIINGLEKMNCSIGHLEHCVNANEKGLRSDIDYVFFGKKKMKGTMVLHTKNGNFKIYFETENFWAKKINVLEKI